MAYDYAIAAQANAQAPLPVFVPLGGYTDDGPFDAYLAHHLGPLATYLDTYRASGRLILLLDGLNEIPRARYAERVGRIQDVLDRYPDEAVVATCRELDYVVKLEQLQKIEVSPLDVTRITWPGGTADLATQEVRFDDGGRAELSEREIELLRYLAANPGRAVSRDEILERVWRLNPRAIVETRTIDMHVARLREKLRDDPGDPQVIRTVRGKGYLFAAEAEGG